MYSIQLKANSEKLTDKEKMIAEYIGENIEMCSKLTSSELASKLNIGQSTIIRFSKKLSYDNFRMMILDMANDLVQQNELREDIYINEELMVTNRKIVNQYQDIAELTMNHNHDDNIANACHKLVESKQVIIFGMGSSNLFSEYLANQLIKLHIPCLTSQSLHTFYSYLDQANSSSLLFLISETGETKELIKGLDIASKRGVYTISMTGSLNSSIANKSDLVLKTVSFENSNCLNVTTMRCSQLLLIDMLYLNIIKSNYEQYNRWIKEAEELLDWKR